MVIGSPPEQGAAQRQKVVPLSNIYFNSCRRTTKGGKKSYACHFEIDPVAEAASSNAAGGK